MSSIPTDKRNGLMLLSRCMQKPGSWIVERISSGQLSDSISPLFHHNVDFENLTSRSCQPLAELLSLLASYQSLDPEKLRKELTRQYTRWATVETNTVKAVNPPSPFQETQDPLKSYRHLPGQEIMEWYHCCGMKMPNRFVGRPDSIHMKLEFTVYLTGNILKYPDDPDHQKTYDAFLRRFFLPHMDRILAQRCGREQFPFYYLLCALIQDYLN